MTEEDRARCREKAYLAVFVLYCRQVLFPAIKTAAATRVPAADKDVVDFLLAFTEFLATDDIDSLNSFHKKCKTDTVKFETLAFAVSDKWKCRILSSMVEYTDLGSLRAHRSVANRRNETQMSIRDEVMANALANLFETSHTFRLCEFTQGLPPKPILQLQLELLAQRRAALECSRRTYSDVEDSDSMDEIQKRKKAFQKVKSSSSLGLTGDNRDPEIEKRRSFFQRGKSSSSLSLSTTSSSSLDDLDPFTDDEDPELALGRSISPIATLRLKSDEAETTVGQAIGSGLIVVALLRHFGCLMCRKLASELAQVKAGLDKLDIKMIAIGTGSSKAISDFRDDTKFVSEIYADPTANVHKFFSCKRGVRASLFNGQTVSAMKSAWSQGYRMKLFDGKLFQLGGIFVLYNGEIIYEHHELFAGDHPELSEVLSACGLPDEMISQIQIVPPSLRDSSDKVTKQKDKPKDWQEKRRKSSTSLQPAH